MLPPRRRCWGIYAAICFCAWVREAASDGKGRWRRGRGGGRAQGGEGGRKERRGTVKSATDATRRTPLASFRTLRPSLPLPPDCKPHCRGVSTLPPLRSRGAAEPVAIVPKKGAGVGNGRRRGWKGEVGGGGASLEKHSHPTKTRGERCWTAGGVLWEGGGELNFPEGGVSLNRRRLTGGGCNRGGGHKPTQRHLSAGAPVASQQPLLGQHQPTRPNGRSPTWPRRLPPLRSSRSHYSPPPRTTQPPWARRQQRRPRRRGLG